MSAADIDEYLAGVDEPKRTTLEQLRRDILAVIPDAEQCLSYSVPGFKVAGKTIAGFAAFKNHLSYLPHSGSVFRELSDELAGYEKNHGCAALRDRSASSARAGREADRGSTATRRRGVTHDALRDRPADARATRAR